MKHINSYNKFTIIEEKHNGILLSMVHLDYYYIARDKLLYPIFNYCTYRTIGVNICKEINKL